MIKAALYCRLSEEDRDKKNAEDESVSIQNQKSMLINYAAEQGWHIYKIYCDENYAGADRRRPDWNELLKDAEARKFQIILCKTQSRFTRELELVEKYIHGLFPIWGIRFVSIVDNADTDNRGNKKSRQINGLVNEWYLEDLSDNIKKVLTERRREGKHIGAFALYGYKKDPDEKGHLVVDEEAARVVRRVYRLYASGTGKTAIARLLNEEGIPNPTEYKRLNGLRSKTDPKPQSALWRYSAIASMLENEMYIGNMIQGKYGSVSYKTRENKPRPKESWIRVENTHEAIIERDLWDNVQKLIKQRAKAFDTGRVGVFSRKVKCMYCGYTMASSKNHGYYYLKCNTRHVCRGACIGSFISQKLLEKIVLEEINKLIAKYLDTATAEAALEEIGQKQAEGGYLEKQNIERKIALYTKQINICIKSMEELYMDKVQGIITVDEYQRFSEDFRKRRRQMEAQISELEADREKAAVREKKKAEKKEILQKYTTLTELDCVTMNTLIDYIDVGKRYSRNESVPIKIHWNF